MRRERKRRPARIARIRIQSGIEPASGGSRANTWMQLVKLTDGVGSVVGDGQGVGEGDGWVGLPEL